MSSGIAGPLNQNFIAQLHGRKQHRVRTVIRFGDGEVAVEALKVARDERRRFRQKLNNSLPEAKRKAAERYKRWKEANRERDSARKRKWEDDNRALVNSRRRLRWTLVDKDLRNRLSRERYARKRVAG